MTSTDLLRSLVAALDRADIPHMLTGSLAAAWYGAGRATLDIDLVIDMPADRVGALLDAISGPGVYVSSDAAREALDRESMFNVIDTALRDDRSRMYGP